MFVATEQNPSDEDERPIGNSAFWPDIDPTDARDALRIDGTITMLRLRHALIEAMVSTNADLANWRAMMQAAGYASLGDVPADAIDGDSVHMASYRRAVFCEAKANLLERYRDYDATGDGQRRADEMESPIDDLRRDARWACRSITGAGRTTVELI
ncbi:head completion/stabilization protein [Craterilacuibacter sp. RT1T]|uniref:head completion/stabilization protein n=1 Tax=Craterilacuibacter sp. RT1T TaxID=2942211 RepID=UPI0020C0853B|nr:head completion/stabilization protein [Craterilacuibacter sp. RT1T]MCL6262188.1 head completion/stabilization protein [Craterilacuibacter sp. RT1T]